MRLTSIWLVLVLALVSFLPFAWLLTHRHRLRTASRAGALTAVLIVLGQLLALLPAGAAINDAFGFYPTWSDLLGRATHLRPAKPMPRGELETTVIAALRKAQPGHGVVVPWTLTNPASGLSTGAKIYVPAAYATQLRTRFPVIELVHGYPGSSKSFIDLLHAATYLDQEIDARRMAPSLVVIPDAVVTPPRDTECVDVPGGPAVETLLGPVLRSTLLSQLRAREERSAWGVMGYSTGGYCAVQLALHHPDIYASAVSMSGYFQALSDITTGDLYGTPQNRSYNSPLWFIHHVPLRLPISMLLATGGKENASIAAVNAFAASPPPLLTIEQMRLPTGGHSFRVWNLLMPGCLDWLSAHLSGPVSPFHDPHRRT